MPLFCLPKISTNKNKNHQLSTTGSQNIKGFLFFVLTLISDP
jgi:hypothetical protein